MFQTITKEESGLCNRGRFRVLKLSWIARITINTVDSGYSHSAYSHTPVIITLLMFPEFSCGQTLINELLLQSLRFLSHSAYNHYFFPSQTRKYSLYSHILGKKLMNFYITYIITVLGHLLQFMQQPRGPLQCVKESQGLFRREQEEPPWAVTITVRVNPISGLRLRLPIIEFHKWVFVMN